MVFTFTYIQTKKKKWNTYSLKLMKCGDEVFHLASLINKHFIAQTKRNERKKKTYFHYSILCMTHLN